MQSQIKPFSSIHADIENTKLQAVAELSQAQIKLVLAKKAVAYFCEKP